jgi:hypothetical protein
MQISGSAFSAGLNTLQTGQGRIDRAASDIAYETGALPANRAQGRSDAADTAQNLIELRQGGYQAQIGAKVVKTVDEVLGTLLDTRA